PRPAGVVEADDRRAGLQREVHDLADLPRVRLGQRASEDGEVLGEHERGAPVDASGASHDAVAWNPLLGHPEVVRLVHDELVELDERPGIEEELETLARGLLARLVLTADALVSATQLGLGVTTVQLFEALLEG